MDKLSRVIFALLFLLASFNNSEIGAGGPSAIAPVTAVKAQGRPSVIAPVTRPAPVDDGTQIDEYPLGDRPIMPIRKNPLRSSADYSSWRGL
jgi:hypothetical protein